MHIRQMPRPRMPIFWGNKDRHGHHDHNTTHVTTTGTRLVDTHGNRVMDTHGNRTVIDTHGGRVIDTHGRGRHGRTVVAAPAANVSTAHVVADRDRHHRRRRGGPSTLRGLWNKILGTLTGNRRRRHRGEREMRRAREERQALRAARHVQEVRENGPMNKLRKFRTRRRNRRHRRDREHHDRHRSDGPVVVSQDTGHRHHKTPWGHHSGRTLPTYHGAHHRFFGFLTGRRDRQARGKAMAIAAEEERRRERRHRREEMREHGRRLRERGLW